MKILIIEDDMIQATKLKLSLNALGYHNIAIEREGASALKLCEQEIIDFVICDLNLPDMDGVQVLSKLSALSTEIGVAIHSAVKEDVIELTINMCIAAGFKFVDILPKPYNQSIIEAMFQRFETRDEQSTEDALHISLSPDEIETAFEQNWFANFYQPQFCAQTKQVIGVEALIRCIHPRYGVLTPASFLEVIHQHHFSGRLFWHVAEKAIAAIARLSPHIHLSINLSQSDFEQDICDDLLLLCQRHSFEPSRLVLELTEHEAYAYSRNSLANLARLRMHGICLSIDDFGTGHASLGQLSLLPFTELKIDRSFVRNLTSNYRNQQLTGMCIQLAHSLGLNCVVEGIEDESTLQYLISLGVDSYQGFYACKPLPISALWEFISQRDTNDEAARENQQHDALIYSPNIASTHAISRTLAKDGLFGSINAVKNVTQLCQYQHIQNVSLLVVDVDFLDLDINDLLAQLSTTNFVGSVCMLEGNNSVPSDINNQPYYCFVANKNPRYIKTIASTLLDREKTSIQKVYQLLSTQEINVANLLLNGLNNKKIAVTLDISEKTVSTYKNRIFKKLGIQSIVELAQFSK